jgi:predicted nucleic acid-binding protein
VKNYWDSSALVAAVLDRAIRDRLDEEGGVTRTHTFAELFSTLTGSRLGFRVDSDDAAGLIRELSRTLIIIDLNIEEMARALDEAKAKGVRGGRVHDYLHAAAAVKTGCEVLLTLNDSDFDGLFEELAVEAP